MERRWYYGSKKHGTIDSYTHRQIWTQWQKNCRTTDSSSINDFLKNRRKVMRFGKRRILEDANKVNGHLIIIKGQNRIIASVHWSCFLIWLNLDYGRISFFFFFWQYKTVLPSRQCQAVWRTVTSMMDVTLSSKQWPIGNCARNNSFQLSSSCFTAKKNSRSGLRTRNINRMTSRMIDRYRKCV